VGKLLFNNTSGGWGRSSGYAGPAITPPALLRAVVRTPTAYGTKVVFGYTAAGGDSFRVVLTGTPGIQGNYDDGPGANSTGVVTGVNTSALYLIDVFVDSAFKVQTCVNRTCSAVSATASGSSGVQPDQIGVGASNANTTIFDGHILELQLHNNATWWNTTVHGTECDLIMGATCTL
jgi:hypothetical protein